MAKISCEMKASGLRGPVDGWAAIFITRMRSAVLRLRLTMPDRITRQGNAGLAHWQYNKGYVYGVLKPSLA